MKISHQLKSFFSRITFRKPRQETRAQITKIINDSLQDTVTFDNHESRLLKNILGLRDITVTDIMVPRADIALVDISDGIAEIVDAMLSKNHSRVPVTKGSPDDVIGFLHIKDVAHYLHNPAGYNLMSTLRQPIFISPTMRAMDLLEEMRLKRLHLALVVDEYGGTDGLITIEDLVEELVGEINDEHDDDLQPVFDLKNDGSLVIGARFEVEEFEKLTGLIFSDDDFDEIDTIGGFVISLAGRVPGRGEIIRHDSGLEFEILDSNPRQVDTIKIHGLSQQAITSIRNAVG